MSTPRDLYQQLRYQLAPVGVTTMGPCSRGCGCSARGSGICEACIIIELQATVPGHDWLRFATTLKVSRSEILLAEQAVEDAERGR